jgi:cytochrome b involved in lipid metabolism
MKAAQLRQKSYVDKRRRPLTFEVGDYVYLKESPMKGVKRFGMKKKLAPRYVGPYKILERKGNVAYKLQLPPEMSAISKVFHVSQLKKCLRVPKEAIAPTNIKLQSDLTYEEKPIRVLEEMERVTRSKIIKFYKMVWNNHNEQDATWEREDYLQEVYPAFFQE